MAAKEFEVLALDGSNFPQWATDIKVSVDPWTVLVFDSTWYKWSTFPEIVKYGALYIIRNHIHLDLKSEYMLEMDPLKLWDSLKQRYEQQKTIVFAEAS